MIVLKFGGTSVAGADAIARAASIVARQQPPVVVVVSALAGVTDRLIDIAALASAGETDAARSVIWRLTSAGEAISRGDDRDRELRQ